MLSPHPGVPGGVRVQLSLLGWGDRGFGPRCVGFSLRDIAAILVTLFEPDHVWFRGSDGFEMNKNINQGTPVCELF